MDSITQLHRTTPEKLTENILDGVRAQINELKKDFQPKEPDEFLTRKATSELLKISLVCLHDWCNKGILKPYKVGNRTYFLRNEIIKTVLESNLRKDI
ncbi:MAG: helix-turn-helix domain-containing protein [Maribacter arcticus]|uniref:helix-turn-helix domain-containing protein n=1 Tax=Maribacter arcticus TaxID=561365 RepID=UPI003002A317